MTAPATVVRGIREAKGISQNRYARQLGITASALNKLEAGVNNIGVETVDRMIRFGQLNGTQTRALLVAVYGNRVAVAWELAP